MFGMMTRTKISGLLVVTTKNLSFLVKKNPSNCGDETLPNDQFSTHAVHSG